MLLLKGFIVFVIILASGTMLFSLVAWFYCDFNDDKPVCRTWVRYFTWAFSISFGVIVLMLAILAFTAVASGGCSACVVD